MYVIVANSIGLNNFHFFKNWNLYFLLQSNVENMSPQIIRQVTKELIDLQKNPPEGIKVIMNEEDVTDIQAIIEGPGNFCLSLCRTMKAS